MECEREVRLNRRNKAATKESALASTANIYLCDNWSLVLRQRLLWLLGDCLNINRGKLARAVL